MSLRKCEIRVCFMLMSFTTSVLLNLNLCKQNDTESRVVNWSFLLVRKTHEREREKCLYCSFERLRSLFSSFKRVLYRDVALFPVACRGVESVPYSLLKRVPHLLILMTHANQRAAFFAACPQAVVEAQEQRCSYFTTENSNLFYYWHLSFIFRSVLDAAVVVAAREEALLQLCCSSVAALLRRERKRQD